MKAAAALLDPALLLELAGDSVEVVGPDLELLGKLGDRNTRVGLDHLDSVFRPRAARSGAAARRGLAAPAPRLGRARSASRRPAPAANGRLEPLERLVRLLER